MFHCLCTVVCLVYSIREITSSMQAVSFISTKLKVTNNRDTDSEIKSHHFIRKHTFTHIRLSEPSHIMCRTSSDVKLLPRVSAAFLQKYEAVKKKKKEKAETRPRPTWFTSRCTESQQLCRIIGADHEVRGPKQLFTRFICSDGIPQMTSYF